MPACRSLWSRAAVPLAVVTLTAGVLAGCGDPRSADPAGSSSGAAGSAPTAPGPATSSPALERFRQQRLDWGSCADFEQPGDPLPSTLQCTRLTVPIDYDRPDGDTARLAVSRSLARGARIGALITNPGGPGVSGLSLATQGAGTPLAERFDVIGLDPRGVGASTPAVRCLTDAEADAERADPDFDTSPAGITRTEQEYRDYAGSCARRMGTDLLAHMGTRETVQDIDILRSALGDDRLTYLGYSYGTRIGLAYAERFPDRVRAMVLDGVVDPGEDQQQSIRQQAAGFQAAFDDYAADCAKSARCPLGTDPARATAAFRDLVVPLEQHPAQTTDPRGLGYSDATTGVQQALYSTDLWPMLTVGLRELTTGCGDMLLHLSDVYEGRRADGTYDNVEDAFNATRCVDDPPITDRAVTASVDADYRRLAPFLDDGHGSGQAPLDLCAFWPVPNTSAPQQVPATGLPKLTVVSTSGDPATPYRVGADLANRIGAALITYHGTQHTVALTSGVACVDDAVISYLIDGTSPGDRTC